MCVSIGLCLGLLVSGSARAGEGVPTRLSCPGGVCLVHAPSAPPTEIAEPRASQVRFMAGGDVTPVKMECSCL